MKKMIALILVLALAASLPVVASAEETTEARVPVTLTVINTERPISVTVPAALPVSVVDGTVLVANNAKITNNAKTGSVQVTGVLVEDGSLTVANFDDFKAEDNTIALSINDIGTNYSGHMEMMDGAFPEIAPGQSLPIRYQAKVAVSETMKDTTAATVIFTIASVD